MRDLQNGIHTGAQIQTRLVLWPFVSGKVQFHYLELAFCRSTQTEAAMTSTGRRALFKAVDKAVNRTLQKYYLTDAEVIGVLVLRVAHHAREHLDANDPLQDDQNDDPESNQDEKEDD